MNEIEKEIVKKVKQWMSLAEEDINLAAHAMTLGKRSPYRLAAYHAQQCAEKYLKAFLVYHNTDFPYTHNIGRLLKLCEKRSGWTRSLKDAETLTPYSITARYPGEEEVVTEPDAKKAIEVAGRVREQVRSSLRKLGVDLD